LNWFSFSELISSTIVYTTDLLRYRALAYSNEVLTGKDVGRKKFSGRGAAKKKQDRKIAPLSLPLLY